MWGEIRHERQAIERRVASRAGGVPGPEGVASLGHRLHSRDAAKAKQLILGGQPHIACKGYQDQHGLRLWDEGGGQPHIAWEDRHLEGERVGT